MVFLSVGLYILIFFENSSTSFEVVGAFWGFMLGLSGCAIGGSIASFNKHCKGLFNLTNQFANGD